MSTKSKPTKQSTVPDFEGSLNELEQLVESMERGDLSLEQSLKQFERGVQLTKSCQQALKEAELRVQQLLGEGELTDFTQDDE